MNRTLDLLQSHRIQREIFVSTFIPEALALLGFNRRYIDIFCRRLIPRSYFREASVVMTSLRGSTQQCVWIEILPEGLVSQNPRARLAPKP